MSSFSALQNHSSIVATTSSAISIRSAVYAGKKAGVKTKRRAEESLKTKKRFQQKSIQETLLNTATSWTALPLRDPDADLTSLPLRKAAKPLPQFTPEDFSVKEEKYAKQVKSGTRVEEENEDEEEYGAEEYEGPLEECEGEGEGFPISGKGVPAVMRCFDTAKIYVKAGDGGNGIVAFRREKYVPLGGPAGGNGGRGGNVYMEVDSSMNSLLSFRKGVHFRAGNGNHGQGRCQDGAKGQDIVVRVAPGTVVRNSADGDILAELTTLGQRVMVLGGGRGGRGNASFKTMKNKAPQIAENGEEGSEMWLDLELKLVADVGIIGVPNAGKSTLLSVISAAKPTIADYPFTTLLPNLGVVSLDYHALMVVADLPGLLEGAHRGYGLGHEFLRHIERCHALVYVVDGSSCQPEYEFDAVRLELDLFSPELAQKPFVVAFNKMDIPEAAERWSTFRKTLEQRGIQPLCMSAVTKAGTKEVVYAAYELLKKRKERLVDTQDNTGEVKDVGMLLRKNKDSRLDDFEIKFDNETNTWSIHGAGLERFIQMTNWEYLESFKRFQHVLEACGVERALRQRGIKEGDSVFVGQMELEWHDKKDFSNLVDRRRYSRGSRSWPH